MSESVTMPANIAIIKYMGKSDRGKNKATNPSVSYTLDYLKTSVELSVTDGEQCWEPLNPNSGFALSEKGKARYLGHLDFLKETLGFSGTNFLVKSGNNFPSDCGIASSASSFAALTEAFCNWTGKSVPVDERTWLSSQGSGSSCRSFFSGWVLWDGDRVQTAQTPFEGLLHMVLLASDQAKEVSSSEAHQRIKSSYLNMDRAHRAEKRLDVFADIQATGSWRQLYEMAWAEFWDMHALFETATPSFGYMKPMSLQVLEAARSFWKKNDDGPVVTMDAGPNVHLLWRKDQQALAVQFFKDSIHSQVSCLSNVPGIGFAQI